MVGAFTPVTRVTLVRRTLVRGAIVPGAIAGTATQRGGTQGSQGHFLLGGVGGVRGVGHGAPGQARARRPFSRTGALVSASPVSYVTLPLLLLRRLRTDAATPAKPVPRRSMEMGSGTKVGVAVMLVTPLNPVMVIEKTSPLRIPVPSP